MKQDQARENRDENIHQEEQVMVVLRILVYVVNIVVVNELVCPLFSGQLTHIMASDAKYILKNMH